MATRAQKLKSGSWRVRVQVIEDGIRGYRSFTASTKKQAEFLAAQFALTEREARKPDYLTVGAAIDKYIDARTAILSPATVRVYRQTRHCYYAPIENVRLKDLRSEDIQRAMNEVAKKNSPKTARNVYALLTATLKAYHPDFQPRVDLPKKVRHEVAIPDKDAIAKLLDAAQGTELENAILLAAGYGMRRGEICALLYSDIDRKNSRISITKSLAKNEGNEWVVKAPKSYAGTRTIGVSPNMIERLMKNRHDFQRVCPVHPDMLTRRFMRLCASLGITCRFHDLRHYNASLMLALSVPDKYAMERLGQATPGMIKAVYQHIMSDKREEVNEAVNGAVEGMLSV
ncbi:MAG TPA: site-specific integrase [Candidatus Limiplasma sp.]|nr:site-specific integrase [Candidatus Limiplasma sp.]